MNTAILTFIRAYNHGAVLQCYALHKKLNDLGIDNEVIDYYPEYFRKVYNIEELSKWRWFPGSYIRRTFPFIKMRLTLDSRNGKFDKFIKRNIRLSSKQYLALEDISEKNFTYETVIVGSDQVWSYKWTEFDPIFFLDFPAAQKVNKISYAASFGFSNVPENLKEEYARRLSNWNAYSVREKSGQAILSQLIGADSVCCCDPTLLLTKEEWKGVVGKKSRKRPYIFVYYVNDKKVMEYAKELAERENLDIVTITSICTYEYLMDQHKDIPNARHMSAAAPDDFLQLISNAKYVLTDSFHGTVFSILFHRQFLLRLNCGNNTNNRAAELMKYVGLENRIVENGLDTIYEEIPWSFVDASLKEYRKQSLEYLKQQCCKKAVREC